MSGDDEPPDSSGVALIAGDSGILLGPEVGARIIESSKTKVGMSPEFGYAATANFADVCCLAVDDGSAASSRFAGDPIANGKV